MAGGLTIQDIPSKRPSLANTILCAANPEEFPLLTRAKKGQKLTQMDHSYFVEVKPARNTGGATDGQDTDVFEGGGPRYAATVRAQEFRRSFKVGQQSQEVVDDAAVPDQFAKLKIDYGIECMKDAEARLLSDSSSSADTGLVNQGSMLAGLGERLTPAGTTQNDYAIPDAIRIPSAQVYSSGATSFDENALIALMQARWNLCGNSMELLYLVGSTIQQQFDTFALYVATVSSYTATIRDMTNEMLDRTVKRGVRMYEGSFGSAEVVLDFWLPNQKRGYGIDMEQFTILPFGNMARFKPLPDLGGGPRGLITMTLAAKPGDVRGHTAIKGT